MWLYTYNVYQETEDYVNKLISYFPKKFDVTQKKYPTTIIVKEHGDV